MRKDFVFKTNLGAWNRQDSSLLDLQLCQETSNLDLYQIGDGGPAMKCSITESSAAQLTKAIWGPQVILSATF